MKNIEIYTGPDCRHCAQAKALLQHKGLNFHEHDVSDPAVIVEFRQRLPRIRALPQIFVDGEHIGGLEDLQIRLSRS